MWWGALASAKSMQSPHGWDYGLTCAFFIVHIIIIRLLYFTISSKNDDDGIDDWSSSVVITNYTFDITYLMWLNTY